MSARPDPAWKTPTTAWEEVVNRYVQHRQVVTWRGRSHDSEGHKLRDHLESSAAERLRNTLLHQVERCVSDGTLCPAPFPLQATAFEALLKAEGLEGRSAPRCPAWISDLRKAAVLNRDGYTCQHCGRTAWDVFEESGRTLRFEMDHRTAKSRIIECKRFRHGKHPHRVQVMQRGEGQMEVEAFLAELQSLARAVVRNRVDKESGQSR